MSDLFETLRCTPPLQGTHALFNGVVTDMSYHHIRIGNKIVPVCSVLAIRMSMPLQSRPELVVAHPRYLSVIAALFQIVAFDRRYAFSFLNSVRFGESVALNHVFATSPVLFGFSRVLFGINSNPRLRRATFFLYC